MISVKYLEGCIKNISNVEYENLRNTKKGAGIGCQPVGPSKAEDVEINMNTCCKFLVTDLTQ